MSVRSTGAARQSPRGMRSSAGLLRFSKTPEGSASLLWFMVRTPFALMHSVLVPRLTSARQTPQCRRRNRHDRRWRVDLTEAIGSSQLLVRSSGETFLDDPPRVVGA